MPDGFQGPRHLDLVALSFLEDEVRVGGNHGTNDQGQTTRKNSDHQQPGRREPRLLICRCISTGVDEGAVRARHHCRW